MPDNEYAQSLCTAVEDLPSDGQGYPAGTYENSQLGINALHNINTNAVILESSLYYARGRKSLVLL